MAIPPPDANEVMKEEIIDFCTNHMPELDAERFWRACEKEQPPLLYFMIERNRWNKENDS